MPKCSACGKTINFRITRNGRKMPVELGIKKVLSKDGEVVEGPEVHWCKEWTENRQSKRKPRTRTTRPIQDDGIGF